MCMKLVKKNEEEEKARLCVEMEIGLPRSLQLWRIITFISRDLSNTERSKRPGMFAAVQIPESSFFKHRTFIFCLASTASLWEIIRFKLIITSIDYGGYCDVFLLFVFFPILLFGPWKRPAVRVISIESHHPWQVCILCLHRWYCSRALRTFPI